MPDVGRLGELARAITAQRATLRDNLVAHAAPIALIDRHPSIGDLFFPRPVPLHFLATRTALVRDGVTFGHILTPEFSPPPSATRGGLGHGVLWFTASLLGGDLAFGGTGLMGVPFASATLDHSGNVEFADDQIRLDGAALLTLQMACDPATPQAGAPDAGFGLDLADARLGAFPGARAAFAPGGATFELDGDATAGVYGDVIAFSARPGAQPGTSELPDSVVVPCDAVSGAITVSSSRSGQFELSGTAPVTRGGAIFPISDAAPEDLPQPRRAWGLAAFPEPGLSARYGTSPSSTRLVTTLVALTADALVVDAETATARGPERYGLWEADSPATALPTQPKLPRTASLVSFEQPAGDLVRFTATAVSDSLLCRGIVDAVLDRPVMADGARLDLRHRGIVVRTLDKDGTSIDIHADLGGSDAQFALVAENALIPVNGPETLSILGRLSGAGVVSGLATLTFPAREIIPTLPDPYASSHVGVDPHDELGPVSTTVFWTPGEPVRLAIVGDALAAGDVFKANVDTPGAMMQTSRARFPLLRLLDVSTNADLWGIELMAGGGRAMPLGFDGLRLMAGSSAAVVFTVPGISWEPVVDADAVPDWLAAYSPDDGTPTMFIVAVDEAVPVVPARALEQYARGAGSHPTLARFTLPFGITAELHDGVATVTPAGNPLYAVEVPEFPEEDLAGARALAIRAGEPRDFGAVLPGKAWVGYDENDPSASDYGAHVIGIDVQPNVPPEPGKNPTPAFFFDETFRTSGRASIPVSRVGLTGWGTSVFSDWFDPDVDDTGVVRAMFNVLTGRTAHELVQFQLWILPWSIRVQRTVVFDRHDDGEVLKHDSGWKAVGDGRFELLKGRVLAGPVEHLENIRDLRFPGEQTTAAGFDYARVFFDADVVFAAGIDVSADGKQASPSAAGRTIAGWATTTVGPPPQPNDILELMAQAGRTAGATAGVATKSGAAASRFTMAVSSFAAAAAPFDGAGPAQLQVALFGAPRLPKDGQWSIARRPSNEQQPTAVDPAHPVPMTRSNAGEWRLMDPEDAQVPGTPATFYGLLQGTGTSKSLFEHPQIADDGGGLAFDNEPQLADVGALLGVGGLFPSLASALTIPVGLDKTLPISGDGFSRTYTWPITEGDRSLLELAIVHVKLAYQSPAGDPAAGMLKLDAKPGAPNWHLELNNISFVAAVDGFGDLVTVWGRFQAGADVRPGFVGPTGGPPEIKLGDKLQPIQKILTGLGEIAKSLGGDADLEVGFSGQQLTVRQGFTLPEIPLGFGSVTDLGLDLGLTLTLPTAAAFHVGLGSRETPFHWLVSPLAGTGAIVLGIDDGKLDVYIEAGLGLGLGIDVVVASGSASIVLGLSLEITDSTIDLGAMLTGRAEVDVMGGVASASLTLSAAIHIEMPIELPPSHADISAQVAVGIHISIAFVIHVSFDGSWAFAETVSL
ncbi:MAG: hypothetical protein QOE11_1322 [Solirubrobacteraceae bacterium]|nr:hypothetical protein [Solirubrobacteraceae bacterium]